MATGLELLAEPPRSGLVLWLDAADKDTLDTDAGNRVTTWRDKSANQHHAIASDRGPVLLDEKSPMVRFTPDHKPTPLRMPALRDDLGPLTVFVVARRSEFHKSEAKWQRILSAAEEGNVDHKGNGLSVTLTPTDGAEMFDTVLYSSYKKNVASLPVTLGTVCETQQGGGLLADVAELLIYAKSFEDPTEFEAVQDYLTKKWNVDAARDVGGWTREGPIPAAPAHDNPKLPLFDQANAGNWQPHDAMTDEFDGDMLNDDKWWDHNTTWYGRAPARYMPDNIEVRDGKLILTTRIDKFLPREQLHQDNPMFYENYSASTVVSKSVITYGCFEVRIKVADASCTSSFWFVGRAKKPIESTGNGSEAGVDSGGKDNDEEKFINRWTELDVFELPSGAEGHEHKFGMNMHVFDEPETDKHWSNWGNWHAPFLWVEDYHTVNFVWSPDWIRYYVDGHCVRTTRNVAWHTPLKMIFDMEIMSWLPAPKDSEFPATFQVEYVRTWTRDDWKAPAGWIAYPDPREPTWVTKRVKEFSKERAEAAGK